jgi:hypothetical protein
MLAPDFSSELALRQAAPFPQFAQPTTRFVAQFFRDLAAEPLRMSVHFNLPHAVQELR